MTPAIRRILLEVLQDLMPGLDRPGLEANETFTALGMDSMQATVLSCAIGDTLGVSLPATAPFEYPTLDRLSEHIVRLLHTPAMG